MKWASLLVSVSLALLLLAGCQPAAPTPSPTATPTLAPQPTPPPSPLPLTIQEPQDESVVREEIIRLVGRTAPDAVLSVNGRIIKAIDEEGNFTTTLTLTEGPNLIEVIATDYQGNQVSRVLSIIYAP